MVLCIFLNFLEFPKVVGLGYEYLFLRINSLLGYTFCNPSKPQYYAVVIKSCFLCAKV